MEFGDDGGGLQKARNHSIAAGLVFGIAWWIYIDGAAYGTHTGDPVAAKAAGYHWLPGCGVTLAFIMINGMRWEDVSSEEAGVATKARCWLITAMLLAVGCIAAALVIMVEVFIRNDASTQWTGISVFIQCLLIFVSAFVMRFGNMPTETGW